MQKRASRADTHWLLCLKSMVGGDIALLIARYKIMYAIGGDYQIDMIYYMPISTSAADYCRYMGFVVHAHGQYFVIRLARS